jgi:hypothetical protein
VALLDSNINIAPSDGTAQYEPGGNKFGPRVLAAGNSTCQLANIQMSYCGQAGLTRACVQFQGCAVCFRRTAQGTSCCACSWCERVPVIYVIRARRLRCDKNSCLRVQALA